MNNDTAIAQLREIVPFSEFAARYPAVYAAADPAAALDLLQPVHVDLQPAPWPVSEPEAAFETLALARSGLIAGILEGGMAIIGTPRNVFRHLRDEATVRFWLGPSAGTVGECLEVSTHLATVSRKLQAGVA